MTYWPRASFKDLVKQFFATGAWRAVLTKRHPGETPWRFYMPGTLVLGLALSLIVLVLQLLGVLPLDGAWAWWSIVHLAPITYAAAVLFACTRLPGLHGLRGGLLGVWALVKMHLGWGTGFLYGVVGGAGRTVDKSRM